MDALGGLGAGSNLLGGEPSKKKPPMPHLQSTLIRKVRFFSAGPGGSTSR